jgi:putative ABC transport system permease protein
MIKNYFKVAFRYLSKHKGYTLINVSGLAVSVACCILIMLFVRSELSFDRFHTKSDRIYRAWLEEHYEGQVFINTVTPIPLGPVLQANLPEVESTCRVAALAPLIKYNNNTFTSSVNMVDSTFFNLFDFELKEGNEKSVFQNASSLVISAGTAKKYFGKESPLGKNLELQLGDDKVLFTVTGVVKDAPLESSIRFDMLIPFSNAPHLWSENTRTQAWSNVSVESYVMLKKEHEVAVANAKIPSIMNPLVTKNYKPGEYLIRLQPITDIHLNSSLPAGNQNISDPKYSYILGTIGILILLIACINFVTLSIGRSTTRALEVGVRKVLGADRQQLVRQFWGEALLLTLIALVIGIVMAVICLKPFNQLANRELGLTVDAFTVLFCFVLILIIGFIAGIYPAIVLSGFKPIQVLKGRLKTGNSMGFFRKGLIVGQFVASIIMIIGTITISRQLHYLRSKDLGYNKEHIIVVSTNKKRVEGFKLAALFKTAVEKNPMVKDVTTSLYSMADYGWMNLGYIDDKGVFRQFKFNAIDVAFFKTMNLQLVAGRSFSKDNPSDSNTILVNEALVKEYGWKDAVGQRLPGKYEHTVIGVVKDFHIDDLHTPVKPAVMAIKPDSIFSRSTDVSYASSPRPRISVRFAGGNIKDEIEFLRTSWKSVAGDQDFEYRFLDDALAGAYEQEQRLGNIVRYASFLSIFIACMGLFGLATLVVVRRTKEIGIRKVLGANTGRLVTMLSKDFIVLVIVASLVAFPIAWWSLNKWLQDFAYRIDIPWWIFGAAAILALVVALLTVSLQAIKAALMNPVKSLRTE